MNVRLNPLFLAALCLAPTASAGVEEVLEQVCASHGRGVAPGFNVAVAVQRDGKEYRFKKTCGVADVEAGRTLSTGTPFYLASLTKQFTAYAVLLLEREGKLSLDAPVKRYLPDARWAGDVRVRHLMHHTSGMREHWTVWKLSSFPGDTLGEITHLLTAQGGLDFKSGERFQYTNANYVLLARIVQAASGKPLPEFLRERVFGPLKLTDTAFGNESAFDASSVARGYVPLPEGYEEFTFKGSDIVGDGGMYSSIDDLLRWSREFYVQSLAPLTAARTATTEFSGGGSNAYGAGMRRIEWRDRVSWEHGGGFGGASTYLGTFPEERLSIVVLANNGDIDASAVYAAVRDGVLRPRQERTAESATPATCVAPPVATWFGVVGGRPLVVDARVADAALVMGAAGRPERRYSCRSPGLWVRDDTPQLALQFYPAGPLTASLNGEPIALMQPMAPRVTGRTAEAVVLGGYTSPDVGGGLWRFGRDAGFSNVTSPRGDTSALVRIGPDLHHAPGLKVIVESLKGGAALRIYTPGAWGIPLERIE